MDLKQRRILNAVSLLAQGARKKISAMRFMSLFEDFKDKFEDTANGESNFVEFLAEKLGIFKSTSNK